MLCLWRSCHRLLWWGGRSGILLSRQASPCAQWCSKSTNVYKIEGVPYRAAPHILLGHSTWPIGRPTSARNGPDASATPAASGQSCKVCELSTSRDIFCDTWRLYGFCELLGVAGPHPFARLRQFSEHALGVLSHQGSRIPVIPVKPSSRVESRVACWEPRFDVQWWKFDLQVRTQNTAIHVQRDRHAA